MAYPMLHRHRGRGPSDWRLAAHGILQVAPGFGYHARRHGRHAIGTRGVRRRPVTEERSNAVPTRLRRADTRGLT